VAEVTPSLEERLVAPRGSALSEIYGIAVRHGLDPEFPEAVRQEVEQWLRTPGIEAPDLDDLTALPFVTIDDASSRDLDQAIAIECAGERAYIIRYALADASYYCPVDSALFAEALRRGASYYLPGFMVPMLPPELSEGLVSLNPGERRRALVVEMHLQAGAVTSSRIYRARIRSEAKLSFDGVQAFYDDGSDLDCSADAKESLRHLRDLGEELVAARHASGALRYRRTEIDIDLGGAKPRKFLAVGGQRARVERYNEEVSLLCNTVGARWLRDRDTEDDGVEPIFRIHDAPTDERMSDFESMLAGVVRQRSLDPQRWAWSRDVEEALAAYLERLPDTGRDGRVARAIHRQAVMINHRSVFSDQASPHFGVGADVYARFSSPMREVVGVFVHKEALERLGLKAPGDSAEDRTLRETVIERANQAKWLQKQLNKEVNALVIGDLCRGDLASDSPTRHGTVMGLTPSKVHIQLDEPPVDLKVYIKALGAERGEKLRVDRSRISLRTEKGEPVCTLGDEVKVRVRAFDERQGRWHFALERM